MLGEVPDLVVVMVFDIMSIGDTKRNTGQIATNGNELQTQMTWGECLTEGVFR